MNYTDRTSGQVLSVKKKEDVVKMLRGNATMLNEKTDSAYMKGFSERASLMGCSIRFNTKKNFVDDLIKCGLLMEGIEKPVKPKRTKKK